MAIPFSNTTQRIPPGFANLLEGLAREVLRNQPEDIPTFAAKYFETLLIEREKTGYDPAEWGAKLDDRYYNNRAFNELAPPGGDSKTEEKKEESAAKPEGEDAAKKANAEEYGDVSLTEEQAATRIQSVYRGFKTRKEGKLSSENVYPANQEEMSEPDPKGTSEPDPKGTSEPDPKGTSEPDPKGTSEPDPKGTSEPDPKEMSEPVKAEGTTEPAKEEQP
ncbi:sperm surface protein Sp17 [Hemicordylus capensis]|uniref:sperm surface protein Sp17 n=1 Tax=Hemicordylus capensis TaxID=884348 RepID=UPI002303F1AE|nr:sperm surface protein Sp17 [Hemicordylus capensis]